MTQVSGMEARSSRNAWCRLAVTARRVCVGWVAGYLAISLLAGTQPWAEALFRGYALCWLLCVLCCRWNPEAGFWELALTNVAAALLLGEATLQSWAWLRGESFLLSGALDGHKLAPGRDYGHGLVGNRLGYPGPLPANTTPSGRVRVAVVGDSFTIGPAVAYADNFVARLAGECEVVNFGVSGAGPRSYLTILEHDVFRFHPDWVLLCVFVGNDITERLATPRRLSIQRHALYWLTCRCLRRLRYAPVPPPRDRRRAGKLPEDRYWEVQTRRAVVCRTPVPARIERDWRRTEEALDTIADRCRSRGVRLAVVLIPDEFQVDPTIRAEVRRRAEVPPTEFDNRLPQRRLRRFFSARKVPCLDLLDRFEGKSGLYAPFDTHWNEAGNRLAAETIRPWLRELIAGRQP